jgi:hypothetical protein
MRAILLAAVSLPLAPAVQAQAIELYATFTNTCSTNIPYPPSTATTGLVFISMPCTSKHCTSNPDAGFHIQ